MSENKGKLPKEVADAIEHLKRHHGGNETILAGVLGNANGSCIITLREYARENTFDKLLQALVNGYEVEQTPEEKFKDIWINLPNQYHRDTAMQVLNVFNIKIEGVNA